MTTHLCGVERGESGRWRAWCSCGWTGDWQRDHLVAAADAGDHKIQMERGEGAE